MPARNGSKKASTGRSGGKTTSKRSGKLVADVMTSDPITMIESETVVAAAKAMRDNDIGDVIVLDDTSARCKGIATDRDMVVRCVAEELEPSRTTLASVCTTDIVTVSPDDPVDKAVEAMRKMKVRRLPVCEGDQPVGIVSMGDLAMEMDKRSALAEVSAAPANN